MTSQVAKKHQSLAFSVGDRVSHFRYGEGSVTAVVRNKLTVHLDRCHSTKCVIADYVKPISKSAEIIPFPAHRIIRRVEYGVVVE
jgi:hypothetical protein